MGVSMINTMMPNTMSDGLPAKPELNLGNPMEVMLNQPAPKPNANQIIPAILFIEFIIL